MPVSVGRILLTGSRGSRCSPPTNVADKDLNIELVNERAALLADVADQVSLMKQDLADLLRVVKP